MQAWPNDENNIAKLVANMWADCSNRLFQSTFSEFNAFAIFSISLTF